MRAEVSEAKASYRKEARNVPRCKHGSPVTPPWKKFVTSKRKPGIHGNDKNRSQVSSAKRASDAAASVSQAREG